MEGNKKGILLPRIYTKETWERGGKRKEHKKYIGKHYISWSQIESFNGKSGFNTGLLGQYEYIRNYFSKERYTDMGWGYFGSSVEAYITLRDEKKVSDEDAELIEWARGQFNDEEKETLHSIEPLGMFQFEICLYIKELDVIVLGYIDDMSIPTKEKVIKILRDYKTKSESSKSDLHDSHKYQLDLYYTALEQIGYTVESAEYCIIERLGGKECFGGGGKDVLHVGEQVWYEPYKEITKARQNEMMDTIIVAVSTISSYYKTYLKLTT